jgi:quercetin dioxygenase-like cupin family protein
MASLAEHHDSRSSNRLAAVVAARLQRLISRKGRTLERLSELSGIELGELERIQAGAQAPTLDHLWRLANALGVPFGSLIASGERNGVVVLRKSEPKIIGSSDGNFLSRALFPYDCTRAVEFYEIVIAPHHVENATAHPPGTKENLVVLTGEIEVAVGKEPPERLVQGDAIVFSADVQHSYRNLGATPATLYMVVSYQEID